jgi:hypothetical protein
MLVELEHSTNGIGDERIVIHKQNPPGCGNGHWHAVLLHKTAKKQMRVASAGPF